MADYTPSETCKNSQLFRTDDILSRLLEAGNIGGCPEGDFLALMPSVRRETFDRVDVEGWLQRLIGF